MRSDRRIALQRIIEAFVKDDLTTKEIIAYVSAIAAIAFGALLLWWPPSAIPSPGNVAIAMAFITGGFATLGVAITVPAAIRQSFALGYASGVQGATFSGFGQLDGEGHPPYGHGYLIVNQLTQGQARQVAGNLRAYKGVSIPGVPGARIDQISIMSDNNAPAGGDPRPDGDTVIAACSATLDTFASEKAHQTLHNLALWVPGVTQNKGLVAHFCCVSDM